MQVSYDGLHYAGLYFILGPVHNTRKALDYTHFVKVAFTVFRF